MKTLFREFKKGITSENPVLGLALGLCPALAVSTSIENAIGMGIAATFVLLGSNVMISSFRNIIPDKIRIPCFIVIIATFVTMVELVMAGYLPALSRSLGIYVPLIVVNCIVLGRAEAFAHRNNVLRSVFDALGMGAGFTLALLIISAIREFFGAGELFGLTISRAYKPAMFFILAPGALLTIGLIIGFCNYKFKRKH